MITSSIPSRKAGYYALAAILAREAWLMKLGAIKFWWAQPGHTGRSCAWAAHWAKPWQADFVIGNANRFSLNLFAPDNSIASTLANEFAEADPMLHIPALLAWA